MERAFSGILLPYIKVCKSQEEREMRAEKSAKYLFRFVYFTSAVTWGWSILLS
jgi:hypothetical protein